MQSRVQRARLARRLSTRFVLIALLAGGPRWARADDEATRFDTPEAALKGLIEATQAADRSALRRIFGPAAGELLSGDEVADRADLERFAKALQARNKLVKNEDGSMTVAVGNNEHPFAIPLVQKDGAWFFDADAGKEELLNRRIGDNELRTIAVCRGYVVAQREYAQEDRDGDQVIEYAQRGHSTPGQKDGLYWETAADEEPSPLGPLAAEASSEGYGGQTPSTSSTSNPYHGYVYKILKKQGSHAPGGKFDYIINGNMVAGFALVATPVEYGNSGVVTFLVNSNGTVLEKDLGEKTRELVEAMDEYDPDDTWKPSRD